MTSTTGDNPDPKSQLVEVPLGLVIRAAARSGDVELTDYLFAHYNAVILQLEQDVAERRESKLGRLLDIERGPRGAHDETSQVFADVVNRQITNVKRLARELF